MSDKHLPFTEAAENRIFIFGAALDQVNPGRAYGEHERSKVGGAHIQLLLATKFIERPVRCMHINGCGRNAFQLFVRPFVSANYVVRSSASRLPPIGTFCDSLKCAGSDE